MGVDRVLIMRGPSGSGKSTFARSIPHVKIFSADHFFYTDDGREYVFDVTKLGEAHAKCLNQFMRFMAGSYYADINENTTVVVDNTNIRLWEFASYVFIAEGHGFKPEIHEFIGNTLDLVNVCTRRTVHDVSRYTIANQFSNFEDCPSFYNIRRHNIKEQRRNIS